MFEHLPECDAFQPFSPSLKRICICSALHTCEQRVENEQMEHMLSHKNDWIADGIKAARHAVAVRLTQMGYDTEDTNPYLSAIDQLIANNYGENYEN